MKSVIDEIDKILVESGKYKSMDDVIRDALRALIRAKPELRNEIAIELYKRSEVSLSRASEICGLNIEDFKELLKERGIKIIVPEISNNEIIEELSKIMKI